jgi:FAD/FMN-containing dehydrogenase/Fe-S oxidoreductase
MAASATFQSPTSTSWQELQNQLEGELHWDENYRILYATDASAYREKPLAVCFPRSEADLQKLMQFSIRTGIPLIPRAAGTSLAGQVIGAGLVVDVSHHMNKILDWGSEEIDGKKHAWVRVQPGVVRDELNHFLKPLGYYFGPETSTANRATIGGMFGNNSCGSNSVIYGSTREHTKKARCILSDASVVEFGELQREEFQEKLNTDGLEGDIYRGLYGILSDAEKQKEIIKSSPKASIPRRNTGYALDMLLHQQEFNPDSDKAFNLCSLLAGSEGTLALSSEITLNLSPLPPQHRLLVCPHFDDLQKSLEATLLALEFEPSAVELMDHHVLECTESNPEQRENRFFVQGPAAAILVIELRRHNEEELIQAARELNLALQNAAFAPFAISTVEEKDASKVWALRKAGLGLLSNMKGDAKPVAVIEDTAVDVADLPEYIAAFNETLKRHGKSCVHYAHAGSGELHLRPILNLKDKGDRKLFRQIAEDVADLVKKYQGSLSGEHGDGRLRGEFLQQMVGPELYDLMRQVKYLFDPDFLLNPGKIIDTAPMDEFLRYEENQHTPDFDSAFDWSASDGFVRAAEQCNGSGDCRKSAIWGGAMCPSFQATRNEKDSTRGRANVLRELIGRQTPDTKLNFNQPEIEESLKLCLSCKACAKECPSNVDMARLKSEWQYQRSKQKGFKLADKLVAYSPELNERFSVIAPIVNWVNRGPLSPIMKSLGEVAAERKIPKIHRRSGIARAKSVLKDFQTKASADKPLVLLYIDEFSNRQDSQLGEAAAQLLSKLNYSIEILPALTSARTYISKGFLDQAKKIANHNIECTSGYLNKYPDASIVGLEPSALLGFVDEFPDLVKPDLKEQAQLIAQKCWLIDEFIWSEYQSGNIRNDQFDQKKRQIIYHGHCHQKALRKVEDAVQALSIPMGNELNVIPSGCCGMAGSFGYDKSNYKVSQQIAELVLFPAIRNSSAETIVVAPGTSCRHQINDGLQRKSWHPVEVLLQSLK